MFAIQPVTFPAIPFQLPAADPAGEAGAASTFEAQFSALLAGIDPQGPAAARTSTSAGHAPRAARGERQEAASGNAPGKQDGKILPDGLAALALQPGDDEAAAALPDTLPVDVASPLAGLALPGEMSRVAAPALPVVQARSASAPAAPAAHVPAGPGQAHLLAAASTAPATATTALPVVPGAKGLRGAAALPLRATEPALPIRAIDAAKQPAKPVTVLSPLAAGIAPTAAATATAFASLPIPLRPAQVSPGVSAARKPLGDALAAALVATLPRHASAEPAAPHDAPAAQSLTGPDTFAAALPPLATGAASPVSASPVSAPQPHDFAALIERLVDARQTVQATLASQTIQATFEHPEFGRLSLQFRQDPSGLTVSFANPEPDLARAVQTMATTTAFPGSGETGTAQRQDGQGGGSMLSGQAQGQAATQQQRGQAQPREPVAAASAQHRHLDETSGSPSAARNGIFA